jgi:hypothetical protein
MRSKMLCYVCLLFLALFVWSCSANWTVFDEVADDGLQILEKPLRRLTTKTLRH